MDHAALASQLFHGWFQRRNWRPFPFQTELLAAYLGGYSGMLNAPTGSGKTYGVFLPALVHWLAVNGQQKADKQTGLVVIWITPVRALANDIALALQAAADDLETGWRVAIRTGDTTTAQRAAQKTKPPQVLVTTPESLHLLLANKAYDKLLQTVQLVVCDEWHELIGSKRGVQMELALSRMRTLNAAMRTWVVSATIGNLEEALEVALGSWGATTPHTIIRAQIDKQIVVKSLLPEEVENYPWGGHLGIKMLPQVLPLLYAANSTLVFTNTRSQCEIWFSRLLEAAPDLAGVIAVHHGSLANEVRQWVEAALNEGRLKVVVCTSSLDLGVDFKAVDQIIQIGGPKGISRFLQRAGRSGHQPGGLSQIWFVPTHSLELVEAAALRTAIAQGVAEERRPVIRAFDVLAQYLVTLAVSEGFEEEALFQEVIRTYAYATITREEWMQVLTYITIGGPALQAYEDFQRVVVENGRYVVRNRRMAMRHRVQIGTITSEPVMAIKMLSGSYVGSVEEYFISRLKPGDVFQFAGRTLEFVQLKDMSALVRKSNSKKAMVPSWAGGRMPFSSQLARQIRQKLDLFTHGIHLDDPEMVKLAPLLQRQQQLSILPGNDEFLIEVLKSKNNTHFFFYTFGGRLVNEGMANLLAFRISRERRLTFSISMNDYGFELATDEPLEPEQFLEEDVFSTHNLINDISQGVNLTELASRKFRDIAQIAGLTFTGMPGKQVKARHLQANSRLLFNVFMEYEPNNLFIRQAYDEVLYDQLEEQRLRNVLERIAQQKIVIQRLKRPSPFCFPIMVEFLRGQVSNESLEDRVAKLINQLENNKDVDKKGKTRRTKGF